MKRKIFSAVTAIILLIVTIIPVSANESDFMFEYNETPISLQEVMATVERSVASTSVYGDYSLKWKEGGSFGNIISVEADGVNAQYTYDNLNQRNSKTIDGVITTFTYAEEGIPAGKIVSENRGGMIISYTYERNNEGSVVPYSFSVYGGTYYYDVDVDGTILSLVDEEGEIVSRYEYEDNIVVHIWEKDSNGNWVDNINNIESIGKINLLRYLGYYFDEETQWYYCGRMYDPKENCFINGEMSTNIASTTAISALSNTPSKVYTEMLNLFDSCMDSSTFGRSIDYPDNGNWYSSLSEVEILARMIYCENTYSGRNSDRTGVAWVAANRVLSSNYPNNLKSVCTQGAGFESITGSKSRTKDARNPLTTSSSWTEAVSAACCTSVCFRYGSNSEAYLEDLMSRPTGLTDQVYFVGLYYFRDVCKDGTNGLMYPFGSNYVYVKQVAVLDVNTNLTTRQQVRNISSYGTYNIFFNEK